MEHWELVAREQIRDLVAAYAHLADTGRFAELGALFSPDGVLEVEARERLRGRDAIQAFLAGAGTHLEATTGERLVRHHVSSHRMVLESTDRARGAAYFLVVTARGPDHWGRYRDVYVAGIDRWMLAHRHVRVDGWVAGSWAATRRDA